jgi:hypothetical protein
MDLESQLDNPEASYASDTVEASFATLRAVTQDARQRTRKLMPKLDINSDPQLEGRPQRQNGEHKARGKSKM